MVTKRVIGIFDCRAFKKDTARSNRKMVAQGDRITLSVGFKEDELTGELAELKDFAKYSEKHDKYFVQFKVFPKTCRLYAASARRVDWPEYEKIDGGRFEVIIDYSIKHGKEGTTELNGVYANAIQVIRRADIPFEPVTGYSDDFISGADISTPAPELPEDSDEKSVDDLPF